MAFIMRSAAPIILGTTVFLATSVGLVLFHGGPEHRPDCSRHRLRCRRCLAGTGLRPIGQALDRGTARNAERRAGGLPSPGSGGPPHQRLSSFGPPPAAVRNRTLPSDGRG